MNQYDAEEFLKNNPDELGKIKEHAKEDESGLKNKKNDKKKKESESKQSFEPKFYETSTGYKKKSLIKNADGEAKEIEITVAPFIIEPTELISCEDFTELNSKITYDGREYATTFTSRDFLSPKEFKSAITKRISPSVWFDGNQKELTNIQKILSKKKVKETKGVKCSGFHEYNREWHYVTSNGALKANNSIYDGITLLSNYKEIENPNIISKEILTEVEVRTIAESLFKFNDLGITTSFIGYISAIFLKERLWKEFNSKFPNMAIIGSSGAGKSQTIESIGMQILNMESNKQQAANQCTKFTGLKNSASSNTAPFIINEYKPHKMPQWIINDIDNLVNNTYDRYETKKGKADLSTETFSCNAPIIILGEAYTADQSAVERIIRLYMSKDESLKKFDKFKLLKGYNLLLNKLGKTLLMNALRVSKEQISKWIECNLILVDTTNIEVTRGKENVAIVLLGLDLLNQSLNNSLESAIQKLKMAVINRYKADTLEGNSNSKTAIGEILELFNQLVIEGKIVEGMHFKRLERNGEIALDVKTIYGIALEVATSRRQTLPLSDSEFTRMLKKEPFYSDYKPVKLKKVNGESIMEGRKCYILNLSKLLEINLEICSITGVDAETVFSEAL